MSDTSRCDTFRLAMEALAEAGCFTPPRLAMSKAARLDTIRGLAERDARIAELEGASAWGPTKIAGLEHHITLLEAENVRLRGVADAAIWAAHPHDIGRVESMSGLSADATASHGETATLTVRTDPISDATRAAVDRIIALLRSAYDTYLGLTPRDDVGIDYGMPFIDPADVMGADRTASEITASEILAEGRHVARMADDPPQETRPREADYHGPRDASDPATQPHVDVHRAAEHLLNGRITNAQARGVLREALDHADKPSAGRDKADGALGRAVRFAPSVHTGLIVGRD